jgi:3-isopropylmalate/(R)-2-methylmalate dehydratase small subunit
MQDTELGSNARVTVDLERQVVVRANGEEIPFQVDEGRRNALLNGLDEIAETLARDTGITRFETGRAAREPWRPAISLES